MSEATEEIFDDATFGNLPAVRRFLDRGGDVNARREEDGSTLLINAAYGMGRTSDVIVFLLERGADVNAVDMDGDTALMAAARSDQAPPDIVTLLLNAGANVHARNNNGETALMYARVLVIDDLVEHGAEIDARDNDGNTPLIWSTEHYSIDASWKLVARGADVNARNNRGETALVWAVKKDHAVQAPLYDSHHHIEAGKEHHYRLAMMLLANGADTNIRDHTGSTALSYAKREGREDIVALLKIHGAQDE